MKRLWIQRAWFPILLLVPLLARCGGSERSEPSGDEVPVRVGLVGLDDRNLPVVVLEEQGGPRVLHIWIGMSEARSIAAEMEERRSPRPNTHDLAKRVIQGLEGEVVRVVVSELREGTYYAILTLRRRGELIEIDARPSDAIAIALRTKSSIFVRAPVFDAAGIEPDLEEERPIESGREPPPDPSAIGI